MSDLVRLTHGVHRADEQLPDLGARVAAVLTACPPGTVASGSTAARLHGLWLPDERPTAPAEFVLRGPVDAPHARAGSRRKEIRGRRRALGPADVTVVDGVAVTSLARTWFELAGSLSLPDLVAAGDSALRSGASEAELDELLDRCAHTPGVVLARKARALLDRRARSRPESHMRVAVVVSGLPVPDLVNTPVHTPNGEWLFEPDLGYRELRLALEYKGVDHAAVSRMRKDMTRTVDGYLRGGWQVIEFGPSEVFLRPDQVAAMTGRTLRDRAVLLERTVG